MDEAGDKAADGEGLRGRKFKRKDLWSFSSAEHEADWWGPVFFLQDVATIPSSQLKNASICHARNKRNRVPKIKIKGWSCLIPTLKNTSTKPTCSESTVMHVQPISSTGAYILLFNAILGTCLLDLTNSKALHASPTSLASWYWHFRNHTS